MAFQPLKPNIKRYYKINVKILDNFEYPGKYKKKFVSDTEIRQKTGRGTHLVGRPSTYRVTIKYYKGYDAIQGLNISATVF